MRRFFIGLFSFTILTVSTIFPQNVDWEFLGLEDEIIFDIAIDDSGNIYVAGENVVISKSSDNGATWESKVNGITSSTGVSLDIDSQGSLYLAALGGIFKSTNGGDFWIRIDSNIPDLEFVNIKIIPNDYVFVSNLDGIYRSTDYGGTWIQTDYTVWWAIDIGINANGIMIAGNISASWFSIYRSTNLGENWTFINKIAAESLIFCENGDVFAGNVDNPFFEQDIYKSTDDGITWIRTFAFQGGDLLSFPDMELDSNGDFYVMINGIGFNGVHISTDAGITWLNYGNPGGTLTNLAIDSSGYIYAGTNQNGIFRTAGRTVPVELISFEGDTEDNTVILNWKTASENNNMGFEVEKKSGKGGWLKIGFVPGFGTSTDINSYEYTDVDLAPGKYLYRLKQIDYDGTFNFSDEIELTVDLPDDFNLLEQNYPNPFNPTTTIEFFLSKGTNVTLKIYNIYGEELKTLINKFLPQGRHSIKLSVDNFLSNSSSGIYFYKLLTDNYAKTKKMVLVK
jgi:photosystem II stability/assembly factor-like uncharacterized protein